MQVFLQKAVKDDRNLNWRLSIVCISQESFARIAGFELLRRISHRYRFGTYIHFIKGYLSTGTHRQSLNSHERLIRLAGVSHSKEARNNKLFTFAIRFAVDFYDMIERNPDWNKGVIKIFVVFPDQDLDEQRNDLLLLIETGRLPISPNNNEVIEQTQENNIKTLINDHSVDADLTIIGWHGELLKTKDAEIFLSYDKVGNILLLNGTEEKEIK